MKIYVCHQGTHIHKIGYLVECQVSQRNQPELTKEEVAVKTVSEFAAFCFSAGHKAGRDYEYEQHF